MNKITDKEFEYVMANQKLWVTSNGSNGSPANFSNCDLSGRVFHSVTMKDAKFTNAKLDGVVFFEVKFESSYFDEVEAYSVKFDHCELSHSYFNSAVMPNAIFKDTKCLWVSFNGANLRGGDFVTSKFANTIFNKADMTSCLVQECKFHHSSLENTQKSGIRFIDNTGIDLVPKETKKNTKEKEASCQNERDTPLPLKKELTRRYIDDFLDLIVINV